MSKKKIRIGSDADLSYQAKNDSGGVIDITNAEITFIMKAVQGTQTIEKRNTAAGGDDTEIKHIDNTTGVYAVYITRADTVNLAQDWYRFSSLVTVNGSDYVKTGMIYLEDSNITADGIALSFSALENGDATNLYLKWNTVTLLWEPALSTTPIYTTAERDALTPVNGLMIYNSTVNRTQFFENGDWVEKLNV